MNFTVPLDLWDGGSEMPAHTVVHNTASVGPGCDWTVLITHQCLGFVEQCLHSLTAFSLSHSAPTLPQQVGWSWTWNLGATELGQLMWISLRGIPYHMMLWSARKAGGKDEEVGMFIVTVFVFPSNHWEDMMGPAF